eukprot:TRINITY_DN3227_c0_g1_i1.p2 TRINITY_DN3227_c0_g1~~TRINITY_DN3227_c0_g1_i1.p2  ORF type:complete len:135 (+),score=32.55 TRINITY_DN3227_c0_g1_i1:313-717(+)
MRRTMTAGSSALFVAARFVMSAAIEAPAAAPATPATPAVAPTAAPVQAGSNAISTPGSSSSAGSSSSTAAAAPASVPSPSRKRSRDDDMEDYMRRKVASYKLQITRAHEMLAAAVALEAEAVIGLQRIRSLLDV